MIDTEIIKITLNAKYNKLLSDYDFEITKKNKTCGDLITIRLSDKKKTTLTYDAKSCFFTKAAAEILSKNISKYNLAQLKDLKDEIRNYFKSGNKKISKNLKPFKIILNKKYKMRKDCILLPISAVIEALDVKR